MDSFDATMLGLVVAGTLVGTPWFVYRAKRRARVALDEALEKRAKRTATARATIASMERTGLTINDVPQVALTMRLSEGASGTLEVKRLVDPLEAARFQPGASFPLLFDPGDSSNAEVDFEGKGAASSGETVNVRGAPFEWPLWLFGQRDAESWLLPARAPGSRPVVVMELTDPHSAARTPLDEAVIEMGASMVAEALWMTTDVRAAAMALVATDAKKLFKPVGASKAYDEYTPFLRERDQATITLWGAAREDLASRGLEWNVRVGGDPAERTFAGPLGESTEMIVAWLVGRGLTRRVAPPAWWTPAGGDSLEVHAVVMHNLRIQVLADSRNGALGPIEPAMHVGFVDLALDLAEQHRSELHTMLAATTAHYARRAGQLTDGLRDRAIRSIESWTDPGSAVHRLSPHWLASLGGEERAKARRLEMAATAGDAYGEWLAKLAEPETD
ncbi:MAG TPA: hypothetical protein VIF09_00115 [Polyangiaceae bacterium]